MNPQTRVLTKDFPVGDGRPLTDLSLMPYGIHQGQPMIAVPPQQLCVIWNKLQKRLAVKYDTVAAYIWDHIEQLKHDYPEGDWD
jgi:hypothetical protein